VTPIPPVVAAVYESYPAELRSMLLDIRTWIFEVAAETPGVGSVEESLRWGEPAYLTTATKSGTTIRLGIYKGRDDVACLFVNCKTSLIESFRTVFGDQLRFEGIRAIEFPVGQPIPEVAVKMCLRAALTYHQSRM
jgi:hypothetical protein